MAKKKHALNSESELLEMLAEDDSEAFDVIYNAYCEKLFLYVGKVIRDEEAAQDIVQDLFISFWTRRHDLGKIESLSAYLYTAARHKAFTFIKGNLHKNNFNVSITNAIDVADDSLQLNFEAMELKTMIDDEIEKLPERMRTVYIMSRRENLSHREISEKLNIANTTVKKQIGYALKHLRLKLNGLFTFMF